ncbi:ligase-associated DNA damage response exonuclease [Cyclobacterium plantarum]|uniref:Ligase-associated DNA damage response exonuclease n=1 Tax=Cyclobacterium plantarum TaxID=2716263 RepID=A0ABX0HDY2_9BACT|nr:ligase-associated DNA damage response exonuclease [Cyclobacterium plantarum]NHE58548.1 ligase-associated DNA damage response exonuclease [Cyclobacterium plantarum]
MITLDDKGIFCPQAGIYIDPWKPVDKAVITHAHADHARWGMKHYLAQDQSKEILKYRLGADIQLETLPYGKEISINGVKLSLHPAGHIPGSAQVRLEYKGQIAVISGDYKTEADGISSPFSPVSCHIFVSECTFGLPIYRWESQEKIFADLNQWWARNAKEGLCSVVFAYSLGKAQRILRHLELDTGHVYAHGAIWNTNEALAADGFLLPEVQKISREIPKENYRNALVLAPPSAAGSPWMKQFFPYRTAICSGWMNIRGARRRRAADAGFVLSDHADWTGLNEAIVATGASKVYLTHGSNQPFARHLQEAGLDAEALNTLFKGESSDAGDD